MRPEIKRFAALIVIIGLAGAGAIAGRAEMTAPSANPTLASQKARAKTLFFQNQTPFQHLATYRLLDAPIHNAEGKIIGDIEELIVSTDNRIIGVIMGVGGALGFGEKKIAVRMSALQIDSGGKKIRITLNATPGDIKNAPAYKANRNKRSLLQRGTAATKKVLKKAARKTSETVAKAKEVTRKAVEPAQPAITVTAPSASDTGN